MVQSTKFWDRIAERYSKQPVADEAAYQKKLQVTREYFRPDMEVLEFGCGTGSTAIAHAPYVETYSRHRYLIENDRNRATQSGRGKNHECNV
jgi:cyclopropane fatty-acyl-phospholipid synthase-like methyltransferase